MIRFRPSLLVLALAVAAPASAGPVLRDDFSSRASGWPHMMATRSGDLGVAVYTDSGKYQLTPVQDEVFGFIGAPRQPAGGDVKMEADLFLYAGLGAGAGGMGCRHRDHRNFYAFTVRGDALMMIIKVKDGQVTPLAQARINDTLLPGTVDTRLTVECRGETLRFSASNGGSISARDSDFADGNSGLFVIGQTSAGTSAVFDNFVMSE